MNTRYFELLGYILTPLFSLSLFYSIIYSFSNPNLKRFVAIPVLIFMVYCCFNLVLIDEYNEKMIKMEEYKKEE